MIVRYFCFIGITITPDKADAPLPIDANTVLSLSIASERLQVIAGRHAEVGEVSGRVKHP